MEFGRVTIVLHYPAATVRNTKRMLCSTRK
ncbi:unnamed protein product [Lathyrus oleraceus]